MRVLMFGWEFPPWNSGGLGVACEGLSRALAECGTEVTFVLPKRFDRSSRTAAFLCAEEILPGLFVKSVPLATSVHPYPARLAEDAQDASWFYGNNLCAEVRRYGKAAARIAAEHAFDLIHAHDWLSFIAGLAAKRVSGKPLVLHVHATEYDRTGGHRPHRGVLDIEREGLAAADLVLAVSDYTKRELMGRYGVPAEKIVVCHNGVDAAADEQAPAPLPLTRFGRRIVLFVGRLTLQKGPDYFLRAAHLVAAHEPTALFVIAGSGDMEQTLIAEAAALGLGTRVIFTGFLRGAALARLYASADVFVMSSVSEPFGLAALEAARARVPLILSKQAGVAEVMRHALFTDFWDIRAMAAKIIGVLRYRPLREALGESAAAAARRLTWDRSADRCLEAYGRVTSGGRPAFAS